MVLLSLGHPKEEVPVSLLRALDLHGVDFPCLQAKASPSSLLEDE